MGVWPDCSLHEKTLGTHQSLAIRECDNNLRAVGSM